MICKFLHSLLILTAFAGIGLAQDYPIEFLDTSFISVAESEKDAQSPPPVTALEAVTDTLSSYGAGQVADHQIGFLVPEIDAGPPGLVNERRIVVTFPFGFDLSGITSVATRDTDPGADAPPIETISVYSQSVVVVFSKDLPKFESGTFFYLDITGITNPDVAREYSVTVRVDNRHGQTIAGPTQSEPFTIVTGTAAQLEVRPSNDTTLRAGAGIYFEAFVVDEFGNEVESAEAEWTLDPSMDDIGTIYGSFLQATVPGTGRVLATVDTLKSQSGLITVLPGTAAAISIETDAIAVNRGQPLTSDVAVEIKDRFGNRKTDFTGTVWFTTTDSLAEIVHDETNPYQFTAQDAGRAVFAGAEFVFGSSGVQTLTATTGPLETATRIAVLEPGGGDGTFDIILPITIVAGEPFDIIIRNAVDSAGEPFSGVISVAGGRIAPNGTEPSLPEITVTSGQGSGTAILYGAGANPLIFLSAIGTKSVTAAAAPGKLGSLSLNIDRIQFIDNPFRGTARVEASDAYGNRKTDMASSGITLTLNSQDGILTPDTIGPGQFNTEGVAYLTGYIYSGKPGDVVIEASALSTDPIVQAAAEVEVNGLYLEVRDFTGIPPWIPEGWMFSLNGDLWNPGSLSPDSNRYEASFDGSDSPDPHIFPPDCDPLPNMGSPCRLSIDQATAGPPGEYEYRFIVTAYYTVNGEQITAVWSYTRPVTIRAFTPFTVDNLQLPNTILQAEYTELVEGILVNSNDYSEPIDLNVEINIATVSDMIHIGVARIRWYEWPPQHPLFMNLNYRSIFDTGIYDYVVRIYGAYRMPDGSSRISYIDDVPFAQQVEVIPRAAASVDPASIVPTSVPAGAAVSFDMDLDLAGAGFIEYDSMQTILTVTDGEVSSSARITTPDRRFNPGENWVSTGMLTIPYSWDGKNLTAGLHIVGSENNLIPVDTVIAFDFPVTVETSEAAIQGLALVNSAPNSPFVNTGQQFILNGSLVNLTASDLIGPFRLTLRTDGGSDVPPAAVIPEIAAFDTVKIAFAVTAAGDPTPAEVFSMQIQAPQNVDVMPAIDDNAVAVIQTPAQLTLEAEIPGKAGLTAILAYGESFDVMANIVNEGQAQIRSGRLVLRYTGPGDFGIGFPAELPLDSQLIWSLTAPDEDIISRFTVAWAAAPIDRNTGETAVIVNDSVSLPFTVRAPETRLVIHAHGFTTQPLVRGRQSKLFDFDLENVTNDSRNIVALKSIIMEFSDRDGTLIDPWNIMTDTGTTFYVNGEPVAAPEPVYVIPEDPNYAVAFVFDNLLLDPGETETMEFRLTPRHDTERDYFNIRMTGNMVEAEIADGPLAGEAVPVTGALDRSFEVNIPQSIIPNQFAASFKNYPNPFNPNRERTEIRYNLPIDSDVDIYIYTVTGERVRHLHFDAGGPGGLSGLNAGIYWDGANGDGDIVLNGVYIAFIEVAANGLTAKLKMAVVK